MLALLRLGVLRLERRRPGQTLLLGKDPPLPLLLPLLLFCVPLLLLPCLFLLVLCLLSV